MSLEVIIERRAERPQTPRPLRRQNSRFTDNLNAVRRQINNFAEIRQRRPLFQRNDHILGEDILLISAVEEADGYYAVGVELMHVLRFICVNLIACRKICRKHDRLLVNRMLGGYYHRSTTARRHDRYSPMHDANTLG